MPETTADRDGVELSRLEAGLDALETTAERGPSPWVRFRRGALPPLAAAVLVVVVWQLLYWAKIKEPYELPAPLDVWHSFTEAWAQGRVTEAVWTSVHRGGLGFLFSVAVATPLGVLVARVRFVRTAVGPVLSGLQSLPSVAWVPAAIIWFGLTDAAIYTVVLLGAVPSIANGLVAGIDQVPPLYLRAGRVLGARGLTAVRHVLLPAALPGYLAGLKQGWAFSWRSLMAAELIVRSADLGLGLGQLLEQGRELSDMSLVMASIFLILLVGVGIELLFFAPLERHVLRARGLTQAQ
ncbi:ABC transporter permease [Carbonactinospora thermoautotrophica]|uniref:ABC transporter permease n=1 Tax=Carbonactinospora thermoautotrophica TaxID=1469144 RepID=UPI00226F0265|nr:ABC transporter permease [Carbonactinospora thermoautotrophica]MCX9190049.1 ABC transporter permease [Carbonactinospora thermoautotrophica]